MPGFRWGEFILVILDVPFLIKFIKFVRVSLVNKIIPISCVHFCDASSVCYTACSIAIYLTPLYSAPPHSLPSGHHHPAVCGHEFLFFLLAPLLFSLLYSTYK